jgi:hypothetical protein
VNNPVSTRLEDRAAQRLPHNELVLTSIRR